METRAEYIAGNAPKPTWRVPLVDLRAQYLSIRDEIDAAIARVLERGNYVMDQEVEAFEAEWATFCKAKYAIGVSSCTDALMLVLKFLYAKRGRQLAITTPATFIATTQAIIMSHHIPIFADIRTDGNIDVAKEIKYRRERKGEEIEIAVPVNLYGNPAPIPSDDTGHYAIVEDAAQSHGLPLRGWAACHSFYPSKNLGANGQAGAVVTDNVELRNAIREMRIHGERERFVHFDLTGNHRMDELQAAILRAKLPHLREWNETRRRIAARYWDAFATLPGLYPPLDCPEHVYHVFALQVTGIGNRDSLAAFLKERGIQTAVRYPVPLHLQPALRDMGHHPGDFPVAEAWARENLSLPLYPEMTDEQQGMVTEAVREWAGGKA